MCENNKLCTRNVNKYDLSTDSTWHVREKSLFAIGLRTVRVTFMLQLVKVRLILTNEYSTG